MRVEFENSQGKRRVIGTGDSIVDCWNIIHKFIDDHNYKSYYQRINEHEDGSLWIDVGSWCEFFWITEDGKKLTVKDCYDLPKIEVE